MITLRRQGVPEPTDLLPTAARRTGRSVHARYRPIGILELIWIALISALFILPADDRGYPRNAEFTWTTVNYAPLTLVAVVGAIGIWWLVSARRWFTGPKRTVSAPPDIAEPEAPAVT